MEEVMNVHTSSTLQITEYDYVIIGGGTAGSVVASRLASTTNARILVLEAGNNHLDDPRINIPAGWSAVLGSEVDWSFKTTPQVQLNGRTIRHPQGKVLGGSSAINAEAFIAPSKADLDHWAQLGNPGWDWQSLLPYYRKFHTLNVPSDPETCKHLGIDWVNEDVRGTSGPIQASFQGVVQDPLSNAWVQTFRLLDRGLKTDPFFGEAVGGFSSPITVNPDTKTRSYAANAYLANAGKHQNLTIVTGALVLKVLLESTTSGNLNAKGVELTLEGSNRTVKARKEVILAAGAFQTPKILELSGIGNTSLLRAHGIQTLIDNPNVGENLQDHLMTGVSYEVNDEIFTGDALMRQEPEVIQGAKQMYTTAKAGPLCAGGIGSYAFLPFMDSLGKTERSSTLKHVLSELKSGELAQDDSAHVSFVQSILESESKTAGSLFMFPAQVNLHGDLEKDFLQKLVPGNFVSLGAALLHPLSRGSVHISSSNAADAPLIDPKYFCNPVDVEVLAHYVLFLEKLAASQPLASLLKPDGKRNHPSAHHINDLAAAKKYVKASVISNNHPACTCAMKPNGQGGVVNERLIVHGTNNLRIVDASIMPTIPGGNIQSSVYAVAERAADLIIDA